MIKKKDQLFYFVITVLAMAFGVITLWPRSDPDAVSVEPVEAHRLENDSQDEKTETEMITPIIMVDVKGAVQYPGVYETTADARVKDVIEMAGGMTGDANQQSVNLAQRVYDEMVIYVASNDENEVMQIQVGFESGKVRINTAEKGKIESLPGIGPSKAEAIIQYRKEHGPFKKLEDLLNVSGIGPKTLEKLKEWIIIP
ncbi:MAG: helix-hairpin-helix domain-containing protein [Bacillaceae bacterium]|nr:helix-hairpin-helix domain-containing protein [Bacillaceae bacterium]